MRIWIFALAIVSATAFAQNANQTNQQQTDQVQLQRLQQELETSRIQTQTERIQRDTDRIADEIKLINAESSRTRPESLLESLAQDNAQREAERKAKEAADAIEEAKQIETAKSADLAYLFGIVALPLILGFYLARKVKGDATMTHEKKFGVMVMIVATLYCLAAISASDGWLTQMDALQNIILTLRIRLFTGDDPYTPATIDFPTKYVLLFLITFAAYGFTTYLGITPTWKKAQSQTRPSKSENEV